MTLESLVPLSTILSGAASILAVWVAYRVHVSERQLAQRQLILPLWEYISSLKHIDPEKPVTPDVVRSANTLELVALCWEGRIIDPQIIRRTFRDRFIQLYQEILECKRLPGLDIDGKQLLSENRAACALFDELQRERLNQDRIKS